MDRLQRQQRKYYCRRLVDSLLLSKILRRVCTGRAAVVRSIAFLPLFLIISLRQTSQKELYFGGNQGLHRAEQEVSSILVVSSIPCCFPKSYDGFVPVVRRLYDRLLSYLCFSSFLFDRRPTRSASQPPTALELEAASGYVILLSSFVFVLRVLSIRYSTSDHFSNRCFYLFSSRRQTHHNERGSGCSWFTS
jgi:hypothetical protein